jgi:hypothetical protein
MTSFDLDPDAHVRLDGNRAMVTSAGVGSRFGRVLSAAGAKAGLVVRRRELLQNLDSEMAEDMFFEEKAHYRVTRRAPLGRHGREGEVDWSPLVVAREPRSCLKGHLLTLERADRDPNEMEVSQ